MPVLPRRWDALAWTEFRDLPAGSVAILPVAAIEQHGPHLPLAVDAALNAAILDRALALAPQEMPLLALPPQVIGHSPEHARFPGTLTLGAETILALWTEIGACVARAGVRRLLIFNTHGGQPQLVELACRRLRAAHGLFAVGASWFDLQRPDPAEDILPESERRWGIHGGAVETAMMRHLHPASVRESEAACECSRERAADQLSPHRPRRPSPQRDRHSEQRQLLARQAEQGHGRAPSLRRADGTGIRRTEHAVVISRRAAAVAPTARGQSRGRP